jgi:hypothetical protein
MNNAQLLKYAKDIRSREDYSPYSPESVAVSEEMQKRGLNVSDYKKESSKQKKIDNMPKDVIPFGVGNATNSGIDLLADKIIEQYKSDPINIGAMLQSSFEDAVRSGDISRRDFVSKLSQNIYGKLFGKEQEEEQREPQKTKVTVHRNKYTQVSDEEAGKILNKAEHGDDDSQKQWESLPFNQRRRVQGEAEVSEQKLRKDIDTAAKEGRPYFVTGKQMREGLQAKPLKESRPHELSDTLENARTKSIRDIVKKISDMTPEEREKYLQDPIFEDNPNYKQAKETYLESIKPHEYLRGKKDELIGRQIEAITRSKVAVQMLDEAFPNGLPSDLSDWREITASSNANGERGYQIFNKLFGTKIQPNNENISSIYVHRSGLVGAIVTKDGKIFPQILVSEKYKQERAGLLS